MQKYSPIFQSAFLPQYLCTHNIKICIYISYEASGFTVETRLTESKETQKHIMSENPDVWTYRIVEGVPKNLQLAKKVTISKKSTIFLLSS